MTEENGNLREDLGSEWIYEIDGTMSGLNPRKVRHVLFPAINQDQFKEGSDIFIPWQHDGINSNYETGNLSRMDEFYLPSDV